MQAHLLRLGDRTELEQALARTGCSAGALEYFAARREMLQIYVTGVPSPAASVIKQEMLSRGGDAAVHAKVIVCGTEKSDVIIFGTAKQLGFLADKLEKMPWWGLPGLAAKIRLLTAQRRPHKVKTPCGAELAFGSGMLLMGIINLTDDSFYSDSRCGDDTDKTVRRAVQMAEDGADILDLGAESTRPGASRVPEEEETARLSAAVKAIRKELPQMPLSADTTRSAAARAALAEGADIINDISGLQFDKNIASAAAEYRALLCVMHTKGSARNMQKLCVYENILSEVCSFLREAADDAQKAGVEKEKIIIDPGIGFAKNYNQNLMLLRHCESFRALDFPLLIGASRKSVVGTATGTASPSGRLAGTVALTALCAAAGVDIIRVHDVKENKEAIMMAEAVSKARYE
ncbi:MAG: dihydropteroate synthase [Synergistes sp.]|nr:dihydropteroate synthase [Synergistes sp.]